MAGAPSDSYGGGLFHTASAGNIGRRAARKRRIAAARKPKSRAAYFRQRRAKSATLKGPSKRDTVAELLAEGVALDAIPERLGLTTKAVAKHFEAIKKRLGPQAT
jgi:DNA-binding NarL/FixJ family response regulator